MVVVLSKCPPLLSLGGAEAVAEDAFNERRPAMAKVAPYHTSSLHYTSAERNVYHNDDTCPDGRRIKPEHKTPGTAGRPLCKVCADR